MVNRLKSGDASEENIHKAIIEWVSVHPIIKSFVIHIPNEGKRTPRYGKLMKDLGVRKGVSDLFIAIPVLNYAGAWVEIKSKDGKLTREQQIFLADMEEVGYFTAVCRSLDEFIQIVREYCNHPL